MNLYQNHILYGYHGNKYGKIYTRQNNMIWILFYDALKRI